MPPARKITMAEVAKHKTKTDCWMVIDGVVYDLTIGDFYMEEISHHGGHHGHPHKGHGGHGVEAREEAEPARCE